MSHLSVYGRVQLRLHLTQHLFTVGVTPAAAAARCRGRGLGVTGDLKGSGVRGIITPDDSLRPQCPTMQQSSTHTAGKHGKGWTSQRRSSNVCKEGCDLHTIPISNAPLSGFYFMSPSPLQNPASSFCLVWCRGQSLNKLHIRAVQHESMHVDPRRFLFISVKYRT